MKTKNKALYLTLVVVFSILFCVCKILNFGWLSIMAFFPIILYLIFYIIYGNIFANLKNKTKNDYLFFWLISFFFLLSGLLFADFGDYGPPSQIIKFIPYNISLNMSLFSALTTITLMIVSIIDKKRQKNFNEH